MLGNARPEHGCWRNGAPRCLLKRGEGASDALCGTAEGRQWWRDSAAGPQRAERLTLDKFQLILGVYGCLVANSRHAHAPTLE
jgi:hypothetical protein